MQGDGQLRPKVEVEIEVHMYVQHTFTSLVKEMCIMVHYIPLQYTGHLLAQLPRAGSGAVSKWVICACDSLVDFGAV